MTAPIGRYSVAGFAFAVPESEAQHERLRHGERPPAPTTAELQRIERDALKAIARDIPDPAEFAMQLPAPYAEALAKAHTAQDPANAGCKRVSLEATRACFAMGLTDRDGYLGAFGMAVRREILADEQ